jgi:photosystem II stability/assembly factor-like uncharacterized protein
MRQNMALLLFALVSMLLAGCSTASQTTTTPALVGWHVAGSAYAQSIALADNGLDVCGWQGGKIVFATSHDEGGTWSTPATVALAQEGAICTVRVAPDNARDVAVMVQTCPTCYGGGWAEYTVDRSEDGGNTWTTLTFPTRYFAKGPAVAWQNGALYVVAGFNPFFKPTQIQPFPLAVVMPDQTAFAWVPAPAPLPTPLPTCACLNMVATAPGRLVVGLGTPRPSPLYISTDGGQHWASAQPKDAVDAPLFGFAALADGRTLLANNGTAISPDAGQTWRTLPGLLDHGQQPDLLATADAFASAPDGTLMALAGPAQNDVVGAYALARGSATAWQSLGSVSAEPLLAISTDGAGNIQALWGLLRSGPMNQNGTIIEQAQILQFTPHG